MEEKKRGCGKCNWWIKPPGAKFFHACCVSHDKSYEKHSVEINYSSRFLCDIKFLDAMLIQIIPVPNKLKRIYLQFLAFNYYFVVRIFGKRYFKK